MCPILSDLIVLQVRCSSTTAAHLAQYEFLGKLFGIAIRTGVVLPLHLPALFWKPLVGDTPTRADVFAVDQNFAVMIKNMEDCSEADFVAKGYDFVPFTVCLSDGSKVDLITNGADETVTYARREEYVKLALAARQQEATVQLAAIRRGLIAILPAATLPLLTWVELRDRVCGAGEVDLELLKRHTDYASNVDMTGPVIANFWTALEGFSHPQRRGFLRFATGSESLPYNDAEFTGRMSISFMDCATSVDQYHIYADSCMFNVSLPQYTSLAVMRQKLLFCATMDVGMDGDTVSKEELATRQAAAARVAGDVVEEDAAAAQQPADEEE